MQDIRLGAPRRNAGFRMAGYWIWCPSVIKGEDGLYHMFASRIPKAIPFHPGWMTDSEVVRAISRTPDGPYEFAETVLPRRGAEYWDGRSTHNPRIVRHGDLYVLFYTGITHPFDDVRPGEPFSVCDPRCTVSRSNKRIGVATAQSVHGPWTRYDAPVLPVKPGTFYSFLTSNAAPVLYADGSVYLMFKSRRYVGHCCSQMFIGVAKAKHYLGPYEVAPEPIFDATKDNEIEDPFVWPDNGGYRMIAKDMSGAHCGEAHATLLASSPDGMHWDMREARMLYSPRVAWADGTVQELGNIDRPSLLIEDGRPTTAFFAASTYHFGVSRPDHEIWNMAVPVRRENEALAAHRCLF